PARADGVPPPPPPPADDAARRGSWGGLGGDRVVLQLPVQPALRARDRARARGPFRNRVRADSAARPRDDPPEPPPPHRGHLIVTPSRRAFPRRGRIGEEKLKGER